MGFETNDVIQEARLRTRSNRCVAVLAASLLVFLLAFVAAPPDAGATPAGRLQATPSTTTPIGGSSGPGTTSANLLEGTPTTAAVTTAPSNAVSPTRRVADDNRRVWLVVAALVAVAVLLALLTAWYWLRTRPSAVAATRGERTPPGRRVSVPQREVRAVVPPSADEEGVAEPVAEEQAAVPAPVERAEPNRARRPVRPQRAQREAALRRARDLSR